MVTTTIVAMNLPSSTPLGPFSTGSQATLALLWLWFLDDLDHLDSSPRRTPFDMRYHTLFLILVFKFPGPLPTRLSPVPTMINLQMLGHCDGSLQISLHMGPHMLL